MWVGTIVTIKKSNPSFISILFIIHPFERKFRWKCIQIKFSFSYSVSKKVKRKIENIKE